MTTKQQQIRRCRAVFKVGDEITTTLAIHPGKQKRLFGFAHCAVIFCRIACDPKRHQNPYLQRHDVVEMIEGDLQPGSVSSQGFV